MKNKTLLLCAILTMACATIQGQDYNTAVGLRLSRAYGVNLKHFVSSDEAVEFIVLTRESGFNITGLYEVHTQAFKAERLKGYGGIGAHVSVFDRDGGDFWDWTSSNNNNGNNDDDDDHNNNDQNNDIWEVGNDSRMALGIDLILGMEYDFEKIPFVVGIDWKPAVNLIGDHGASWNQVALSARFVLGGRD